MTESDTRGLEDSPTGSGSSTDSSTDCNAQGTDPIATDDLFQALRNSRRRHAIRLLTEEEMELGTLAEQIAAVENETTPENLTSQERKRVLISLHQVHLDSLIEWGIVDNDRGTISPGASFWTARDALAAVGEVLDRQPEPDVELVADGGVQAGDLTQFQLNCLTILAEEARYGLAIKRALEDYYGTEVNHGRLYPNLDDLVELDLVEKRELDKRTNQYAITDAGRELLRARLDWLTNRAAFVDVDDHQAAPKDHNGDAIGVGGDD